MGRPKIGPKYCLFCNGWFPKWSRLQNHMRKHTQETPFECKTCNKCFAQVGNLRRHKLTHLEIEERQRYSCPLCNRSYATSDALQTHKRRHTGVKRHKCSECSKAFFESNDFKLHMRVHSGEKPYRCEACNLSFSLKGNLQQHLRSQYHAGKKGVTCQICNVRLMLKGSLKRHMRESHGLEVEPTPTGEKPHRCETCNLSFSLKGNLQQHLRSQYHTGKKGVTCTLCQVRLVSKGSLKKHLRDIHDKEDEMRPNKPSVKKAPKPPKEATRKSSRLRARPVQLCDAILDCGSTETDDSADVNEINPQNVDQIEPVAEECQLTMAVPKDMNINRESDAASDSSRESNVVIPNSSPNASGSSSSDGERQDLEIQSTRRVFYGQILREPISFLESRPTLPDDAMYRSDLRYSAGSAHSNTHPWKNLTYTRFPCTQCSDVFYEDAFLIMHYNLVHNI